MDPDSIDSPGAKFLERVESNIIERRGEGSLDEDSIHELADSAVPIYTHERWQVFVDLGAYQEDVSEIGASSEDLTQCAAVALYLIADRLARALMDEGR
jgi:hypothetical protein